MYTFKPVYIWDQMWNQGLTSILLLTSEDEVSLVWTVRMTCFDHCVKRLMSSIGYRANVAPPLGCQAYLSPVVCSQCGLISQEHFTFFFIYFYLEFTGSLYNCDIPQFWYLVCDLSTISSFYNCDHFLQFWISWSFSTSLDVSFAAI